MAQVDTRARNAARALAVQHLQATKGDLRELKHLQLLCGSYRHAQARLFSVSSPDQLPPVGTLHQTG